MPFGSERHVHKFSKLISIVPDSPKSPPILKKDPERWFAIYQCELCAQKAKATLDYIPLQIPDSGIYLGSDNKIYIKSKGQREQWDNKSYTH